MRAYTQTCTHIPVYMPHDPVSKLISFRLPAGRAGRDRTRLRSGDYSVPEDMGESASCSRLHYWLRTGARFSNHLIATCTIEAWLCPVGDVTLMTCNG
jgi:hypothetical protein